jgi:hypothetical protein
MGTTIEFIVMTNRRPGFLAACRSNPLFEMVFYCKESRPATAMQATGGRDSIAPTHSWPRHQVGWVVSVTNRQQFIPGKGPPVPIG